MEEMVWDRQVGAGYFELQGYLNTRPDELAGWMRQGAKK
jgi:hypothetical protein